MVTIGLVIVLVIILIVLGKASGQDPLEKTLEVVELDDDDTKTLRKLIRPRR